MYILNYIPNNENQEEINSTCWDIIEVSKVDDIIIKRLIKKLDLLNSDYDIVIFGHTHRPVNEKHNGILFFNPGTTTPIDNQFTVISSYGFIRISNEKVEPEIIYL